MCVLLIRQQQLCGAQAHGHCQQRHVTLPSADGTANQALKTDASGNLGFASFLLATETTNGQVVTGGVRGAITTLTDASTSIAGR